MTKLMSYRNCTITRSEMDGNGWDWIHDDYDGVPDSPTRNWCGTEKSVAECYDAIEEVLGDG